jgi:hypothetical protein
MFVKLQRPPPEIRIFRPGRPLWSSSSTRRARRPASSAAIMPAAPAPTTNTSTLRAEDPLTSLILGNYPRPTSATIAERI